MKTPRIFCTFSTFWIAILVLGGCASDRYLASRGHQIFEERRFSEAAEYFSKEGKEPGTNQLLFMLDAGSSYFAAGNYEEATKIFLKAEKLAEIKDYTSISEEVGTLATGDNIRGYKGEDFEKVLINVYLALAYASMHKVEDAQVEARKINQLLHRMITEGKRNYQESPFARYLSAVLWETGGDYDSAYIDYKKAYELDPHFPEIGSDLLAMARKQGDREDIVEWTDKFPGVRPRQLGRDEGEAIVVFQRGFGPIKVPRDGQNSSLPIFIRRYSQVDHARIVANGSVVADTQTALDIEATSIKYLEDRIGRMIAAKVVGTVAKGALAYGVGKMSKNEDLGWLTFWLLMAADHADLRCWKSLPADLQMARIPLRAGSYDLTFEAIGHGGETIFQGRLGHVDVRPGKKVFLVGR